MINQFKKYLFFLLALFIFSCNGNGQVKQPHTSDIGKVIYESVADSQNGDPITYGAGDVVNRGYLDKAGSMWFTTLREGVFRYDGETFTHFTEQDGLCDNSVSAVTEDKDGVMWFGTASGLCSYDGKNFVPIPIPKDEAKSDWLTQGYPIINPDGVLSLIQDKNSIFWIGSNGGGAYRYDGKTFTSLLKNKGRLAPDSLHHNVITDIIEDGSGNIWFSSFSHGGVTRFDGDVFTHFGIEDGLGDDMISTSYIDRSGDLWFGTRSGGMSRFDGESFTTVYKSEGDCQNHMASIYEDETGKYWVASFARSGICWYDGESFSPTGIKNSEKLNDIKFVSGDASGNIWFGGRYGILWRYDGKILTDFTHQKRM